MEQRDQIFAMREKLVELRELTNSQPRSSTRLAVRRLASDAGLLRDETLRTRVSRDVRLIGGAWTQEAAKRTSDDAFLVNAFVDDAYECLSATLRSDPLPIESDQALYLIFDQEKSGEEAMMRWMMNGNERHADSEWLNSFATWRTRHLRRKGRWLEGPQS
jgi:hypothetical protein